VEIIFEYKFSCHLVVTCLSTALPATFVFAQWWLFEAATVRVGKRCRINVLYTLTSRHHCANILLWPVILVRCQLLGLGLLFLVRLYQSCQPCFQRVQGILVF